MMTTEQLLFRAASRAREAEVLLKQIWDAGTPITDYAHAMTLARDKLRDATAAAETLRGLAMGIKPTKLGD